MKPSPEILGTRWCLHYGNSRAPLARVVPAGRFYTAMWRIVWPGGALSDVVNLTRARDAAAAIAERGPPARDRSRLRWKRERSETGVAASLIGESAPTLTKAHPAPSRTHGAAR